jgi:septum formation protein
VLGADTIVVIDGRVLGKPKDDPDACAMLTTMAGRTHEVITAVALRTAAGYRDDFHVVTRVTFRSLSSDAIARYVASGEGRDKAGSYAIQGLGAGIVAAIDGCYSNVVGLSAPRTLSALQQAGLVRQWP